MSRTILSTIPRLHMPKKLRSPGKAVDLTIDLRRDSDKPFYTISDALSGNVIVSSRRETVKLAAVEIFLIGRTKVLVNAAHGTSTTTHTFLKLEMPGPEDVKAWSQTLQPGEEHVAPFHFIVPEMLPEGSCGGQKPELHEQHLRLPPTMGSWDRDDLSPNMVKIEYAIMARVALTTQSGVEPHFVESLYPIRLLPDYQEDPPLALTKQDKVYSLEASGQLKKTRLGTSYGKLSATASQPRPLSVQIHESTKTNARVQLRFDPSVAGAMPPESLSISSKLTASTYSNQQHINHLPGFHRQKNPYVLEAYSTVSSSISFPLATQQVNWVSTRASKSVDQNGDSDGEEEHHHAKSNGLSQYVATLDIPVEVSENKALLIPSFHTCLASRIYVLHISIAGGKGLISSDIKLALPVQVIYE